MDIETININNNQIPYLICAYNGTDYITSYANDSLDQKELFLNFITQLKSFFNENDKKLTIYAHNFSSFDGVFLLKHLIPLGKVEPLLFNGKLITIKFKCLNVEGLEGKTIIFKDSMLLLPHALRDLCKTFKIDNPKSYFPFKLTDINYNGEFPSFKYFKDLAFKDYLLLKQNNQIWNFKNESIKYCQLDCVCLHEILLQFNELIFNQFNVNIHNSLTLPALAARIYKIHFMPKDTIYQLHGLIEQNIRKSYTGGAVDLYIPHNKIGNFITSDQYEKLYQYDANGLYASVMANTKMPIGKPIAFLGDIRRVDPEAYGFFYCKITSPDFMQHPILQRRIKTNEGIRTIAGLGSWEAWICSSEMDNAIKFGYQFNIIKGYQFETSDIFSEFLIRLYNLYIIYFININIITKRSVIIKIL